MTHIVISLNPHLLQGECNRDCNHLTLLLEVREFWLDRSPLQRPRGFRFEGAVNHGLQQVSVRTVGTTFRPFTSRWVQSIKPPPMPITHLRVWNQSKFVNSHVLP
jgi:hypothetical protein